MFETLFQFLFEYRLHVFRQGDFRFAPPAGAPVAAVVVVAALAIAFISYRVLRSRVQWRERAVLSALRIAALAIILFCIFRPVLVVKAAVAQQNVVGILIDDSRSMQLPEGNTGTATRADRVRQTFGNPDSPTMKALSDKFLVRTFRFSSSTARVSAPADLTFGGTQTRLANAIESARQELAGLPVSGLVLVTDGADTTDATVADALLASKADALPVFTVGVGQETLAHDIQIGRVSDAAHGAQGHVAARRRRAHADRLRRSDGDARRRRRRAHRRIAAGAAAGRRRSGLGARAVHGDGSRARACSA